jgi:hypothetical protein
LTSLAICTIAPVTGGGAARVWRAALVGAAGLLLGTTGVHAADPAWTLIGPAGLQARSLVVAPSDPNTAYAVGGNAVMSTSDGGRHWTLASPPFSSIAALFADPTTSTTVYANDAYGPPEYSRDGGP